METQHKWRILYKGRTNQLLYTHTHTPSPIIPEPTTRAALSGAQGAIIADLSGLCTKSGTYAVFYNAFCTERAIPGFATKPDIIAGLSGFCTKSDTFDVFYYVFGTSGAISVFATKSKP